MKLLALDTSSVACSVALGLDQEIIERHEEQPREHTRLLLPMVRSVLEESGVSLTDLDAIVLGNGPGSFIGMRIAASVAQGLAFGSGLNIVPVSSLAAVAAEVFASSDVAEVIVAQDAHMNEVYLGGFQRGQDGLPAELFPERLQTQELIEELRDSTGVKRVAAGAGWQRYPELQTSNREVIADVSNVMYPRARHVLALGSKSLAASESIAPDALVPAYLRQKVASIPSTTP